MEVSREEALSMFAENPFKEEIIRGLPEEATISLYRCGPMVDLCHGPHLPNTGFLKSAAVSAMNRAFWRADVSREPLQVGAHYHACIFNFFGQVTLCCAGHLHGLLLIEFSAILCMHLCNWCSRCSGTRWGQPAHFAVLHV